MVRMNEYEEAIRRRVCAQCLYESGQGICGTGQTEQCLLNHGLPEIVETVQGIVIRSLDDYMKAVRALQVLFSGWEASDFSGPNTLDPRKQDSLDQYIPMIIEAADSVNKRRDRQWQQSVPS